MANMTGGTGGTMATWTPEIWATVATVTYRSKTVLLPLMDHRWEKLLAPGGDVINIPSFSQNSGAVARSTFGTAAALANELIATTESQVQLTVNKMAIYGYAVPVEAEKQSFPQYFTLLAEGIGTALALYLDNQLAADNTNGIDGFSTVVGTDNVPIVEDNIITCQLNLDNANAKNEDRFLVLSNASRADLTLIESLRNQLYRQSIGNLDANKGQGFVGGPVFGFDVYCSNNLEAGSAGYKNGAFQREAIAVCVQADTTIEKEFSVTDGFLRYVAGYNIFGQREIKDGHGVELDGR